MFRPARRQSIGSDLPWFAAGLIVAGGVIAIVVRAAADLALHRHRAV